MGDFTDLMNNIPELSPMAKRETYVDQHGIEIQVITPLSGSAVQYISALEVQTNQGPMRLQFGIRAESLEDAAKVGGLPPRKPCRSSARKCWRTSAVSCCRIVHKPIRCLSGPSTDHDGA